MRLFERRRDASPRDPDLPLSVNEAWRLRETVRWVFAEVGREVSVRPGYVEDATGERFELRRLAAACADTPVDEWGSLARAHVRGLFPPSPRAARQSDEELAGLVRSQLVARDRLADPSSHPLSPRPTPDLVELITIAHPDTPVTPPDSDFAARAGGLTHWRRAARQGLVEHLAAEPVDHQQLGWDEAESFHGVASESVFTASFALILPELMERLGLEAIDAGVLLAVPAAQLLGVRVVDGPDAAMALHHLFRWARAGYDDTPGGISPHVYWVHDGRWTQVTKIEGKRVQVSVDEDLAEALGLGREE